MWAGSSPDGWRTLVLLVALARLARAARLLCLAPLAGVVLLSCTDLNSLVEPPLEIQSRPDQHNEVLPNGVEIHLSFDRSMDPASVDELFRIYLAGTQVSGNMRSSGANNQSYSFDPAQDWEPLRRYELALTGYLRDAESNLHRVDYRRAFSFGGKATGPVRLLESYPTPGQTVPPEAEIRLRFSEAMDAALFERAMSLEPAAVTTSTWSPDLHEVLVVPEQSLERNAVYTLRVGNGLRSEAGRSMAEPVELVFLVSDNAELPSVRDLYLAVDEPGTGYPLLSPGLDGMMYNDLIAVRWNVPMDPAATEAATRLEPGASLEFFWPEPELMLVRPRTRLEPAAEYRLRLANTARSAAGLQPAAPYSQTFSTAADTQSLVEWSDSYGAVLAQEALVSGLVLTHELLEHHDEFSVTLVFSASLATGAEREQLINSVRLISLVPNDAPRPVLISAYWSGDRSVSLRYRNLGAGSIDTPYVYLWSLPAGWGGSRYETEELRVLLELYR